MNRREVTGEDQTAALDAYRAAAHAEADGHFDERALETQRHKILERLAHIGHPAKVHPLPRHAARTDAGQRASIAGGSRPRPLRA